MITSSEWTHDIEQFSSQLLRSLRNNIDTEQVCFLQTFGVNAANILAEEGPPYHFLGAQSWRSNNQKGTSTSADKV